MKKVLFITEGGSKFGMGHITRCLSLADGFRKVGVESTFIIDGDVGVKNYESSRFNWNTETLELLKMVSDFDIVILDSLHASDRVIKLVEDSKQPVFIDDWRHLSYKKGVIIDWTPNAEVDRQVEHDCTHLFGLEYCSLRESFHNVPQKKINKEIKNILITMGGSDIRNITPKILLQVIDSVSKDVEINVVIGNSFSENNIDEVRRITRHNYNVKLSLFLDSKEMCEQMQKTDICISTGGQTLYELARCGVPTIVIQTVDNTVLDIVGFSTNGFLISNIGYDSISFKARLQLLLRTLLESYQERQKRSEIGQKLIDGQGTNRIINHLLQYEV